MFFLFFFSDKQMIYTASLQFSPILFNALTIFWDLQEASQDRLGAVSQVNY